MGDSTSGGMGSASALSSAKKASGEEERQKLMAMQEKKENGDKERDHIPWTQHGSKIGLRVCLNCV